MEKTTEFLQQYLIWKNEYIFIFIAIAVICVIIYIIRLRINYKKYISNLTDSDAVYWINCTYAILTTSNQGDYGEVGSFPHTKENKEMMRESLRHHWGINSSEDADSMIEELSIGLHNPRFMDDIEKLGIKGVSESDFKKNLETIQNPKEAAMYKLLYNIYQEYGDDGIIAWDLGRALFLAGACYVAHYYTFVDAMEKSFPIAKQLQKCFNSWDDYFQNYMYGFLYWQREGEPHLSERYVAYQNYINDLKTCIDYGPYILHWNTNLDIEYM